MGKIENDELRRIKNGHFIRAFEYVAKILGIGQGKLAEAIGSKSSYISNYRKGLRPVPEETIARLIRVSSEKDGLQIFSEYLYGNSDIMLLANVTDEEMAAAKLRHANPDYGVMQKYKAATPISEEPIANIPDMSSVFNSALANAHGMIEQLKQRLMEKDELLAEKDARLVEKDERIAELKAHNIDLRRQLDQYQNADVNRYPFPVGSAEPDKRQPKRK